MRSAVGRTSGPSAQRGPSDGPEVHPTKARGRSRQAFTLIEMMIAMVLTLIMVWAIAEFYAYVGETVKDGRAMIEVRAQLRTAAQRLKADLALLTVVPAPPVNDGDASGYLMISEGVASDCDPDGNGSIDTDGDGIPDMLEDGNGNGVHDFTETALGPPSLLGDIDDVLAFTIRSDGEPFIGRWYDGATYQTVASNVAEVIWFTGFQDMSGDGIWQPGEPRSLYRRQLLVRPDLTPGFPATAAAGENIFHHNDISAHFVSSTGTWVANTLADLARRENRFAHAQGSAFFPNALLMNPHTLNSYALNPYTLQNTFFGEDVILSNVLAFDVRVFDPSAALLADNAVAANATGTLQPGDPGYALAVANGHTVAGYGAYVDLWYNRYVAGSSAFSARPSSIGTAAQQATYAATIGAVYDTWATSYERDGLNQDYIADGAGSINTGPFFDEGSDGLDNDGTFGVDDMGERETLPPYAVRLRGLEVKIRLYEPGTRQAHQGTVASDFIPE